MEHLINLILNNIVSIGFIVVVFYVKDIWLPTKKKKTFNAHKSLCYLELDRVCLEIKRSVDSTSCYIGWLHNGGTFINGISMDKFTVVAEARDELVPSYKRKYTNILVNIYSYAFHKLIVENKYKIEDIDTYVSEDKSLIDDLKNRRMKSFYMYLIKDPVKETPLGFVVIESNTPDLISDILESKIWKQENKIAKLLNQTYIQ